MLELSLTPHRGGNNARLFPHVGYLGMSPVVVAGTVKTQVIGDGRQLEASRLVVRVRCYEGTGPAAGQGSGGGIGGSFDCGSGGGCEALASENPCDPDLVGDSGPSRAGGGSGGPGDASGDLGRDRKVAVLWGTEQVVWQASEGEEYELLGELTKSWRLVVPTEPVVQGKAVGTMTLRGWKVWWQVEAVIFHRPAGMNGTKIIKSHGMHLMNYRPPPPQPTPTPSSLSHSSSRSSTPYPSSPLSAAALVPSSDTASHLVVPPLPHFSQGCHPRLTAIVQSPTYFSAGSSPLVTVALSLPRQQPSAGPSRNPSPTRSADARVPEAVVIKRVTVSLERSLSLTTASASVALTRSTSASAADLTGTQQPPAHSRLTPEGSRRWMPDGLGPPPPQSRPGLVGHGSRVRSLSPLAAFRKADASAGAGERERETTTLTATTLQVAEVVGPLGSLVPPAAAAGAEAGSSSAPPQRWSREVALMTPKPRSAYHYSTGESCDTRFAKLRFWVSVKITFKTKSCGTETLDVPPLEVAVGSVSEAERSAATADLARLLAAAQGAAIAGGAAAAAVSGPTPRAGRRPALTGQDQDGDSIMSDATVTPSTSSTTLSTDSIPAYYYGGAMAAVAPPLVLASSASSRPTGATRVNIAAATGTAAGRSTGGLAPHPHAHVRRRSEASDADDAPSRRRPRSAGVALFQATGSNGGVEPHERQSRRVPSAAPVAHSTPAVERRRLRGSGGGVGASGAGIAIGGGSGGAVGPRPRSAGTNASVSTSSPSSSLRSRHRRSGSGPCSGSGLMVVDAPKLAAAAVRHPSPSASGAMRPATDLHAFRLGEEAPPPLVPAKHYGAPASCRDIGRAAGTLAAVRLERSLPTPPGSAGSSTESASEGGSPDGLTLQAAYGGDLRARTRSKPGLTAAATMPRATYDRKGVEATDVAMLNPGSFPSRVATPPGSKEGPAAGKEKGKKWPSFFRRGSSVKAVK